MIDHFNTQNNDQSIVRKVKLYFISICTRISREASLIKPLFFTLCFVLIIFLWLLSQVLFLAATVYFSAPEQRTPIFAHRVDYGVSPIPILPSHDVQIGELWWKSSHSALNPDLPVEPWRDLGLSEDISTLEVKANEKRNWTSDIDFELHWYCLQKEKNFPYVSNPDDFLKSFPEEAYLLSDSNKNENLPTKTEKKPKKFFNSIAVFFGSSPERLHGMLGLSNQTLRPLYIYPSYSLSNTSLGLFHPSGLEQNLTDFRNHICKAKRYSLDNLLDASIVIAFETEPLGVILRSVHSILNRTPPSLLREIILVDAGSQIEGCRNGELLDSYIRSLPKVKLMRAPHFEGIFAARRYGLHLTQAPVVIFLNANTIVTQTWLEPLLQILSLHPQSVVFPQLWLMDSSESVFYPYQGAGCTYRTSWNLQTISEPPEIHKISSFSVYSTLFPHEAFAVKRSWLYQLGDFSLATVPFVYENVELSFRNWQCGGAVYCAPCSVLYHSPRHAPPVSSKILEDSRIEISNRWLGEFSSISNVFNSFPHKPDISKGMDFSIAENMLNITKSKFKCRDFTWFITNLATYLRPRNLETLQTLGPIRVQSQPSLCLHASSTHAHSSLTVSPCSAGNPKQQFMSFVTSPSELVFAADPVLCISAQLTLEYCDFDPDLWEVAPIIRLITKRKGRLRQNACLTVSEFYETRIEKSLTLDTCHRATRWILKSFHPPFSYSSKRNELNF